MIRVIYVGTGDLACTILAGLLKAQLSVVAVFTLTRKGLIKQRRSTYTKVEWLAFVSKIPVFSDFFLYSFFASYLITNLKADVIILASSSVFISKELLTAVRLHCINVHFSLVPRFVGSAPVQFTLACGDGFVCFSLLKMSTKLDDGPLFCIGHIFSTVYDTHKTIQYRLSFNVVYSVLKIVLMLKVQAVVPRKFRGCVVKKSIKITAASCRSFLHFLE